MGMELPDGHCLPELDEYKMQVALQYATTVTRSRRPSHRDMQNALSIVQSFLWQVPGDIDVVTLRQNLCLMVVPAQR